MKYRPKLLSVGLAITLLAIAPASLAATRPIAHRASYIPKWPQDYADSPCSAKNLNWWIKNVAEDPYNYSFYSAQAFCALPLSEVCLAQQYNSAHNTHLPFYTNKTFYRRCQQAYAHIRALRRARPAHWSACDIIGWASIVAGPFIPAESLIVKTGVVVFGASLKLRCG
ncbi:MAG: hypothetical protein JOY58_03960 [Solirubrobacterales bacterium]|nr:hypothetical protein [Solirubrobacterales bacterium]MBV9047397.1 hypothetical protein [Solirubrobacterales bacterium]